MILHDEVGIGRVQLVTCKMRDLPKFTSNKNERLLVASDRHDQSVIPIELTVELVRVCVKRHAVPTTIETLSAPCVEACSVPLPACSLKTY